uniref:ATP synthase F0 subunit 6 n=1 Tax=Dryodurgades tortilis TaxID=2172466 RepID=UPI00300138C8|nr:ATP synthase F0 subunit 6 [Dryodurgades tortilis]
MTNLFSTFDPCTGNFSLNWISTFLVLTILPFKYWSLPNKQMIMFNKITMMMNKETTTLMKYKGTSTLMISMFYMILIINLMGLIPYIFTSSSHLVFSLTLAMPMWMGMMMFGWINKTTKMFIHLVPVGTPSIIMPFMVLIETVSNLIRPGSLAVRLTANMIAGHLLMSLLGNNASQSTTMLTIMMIIFIILMVFETAVAMIQAYVFMTLSTLYSSEI